MNRVRQITAEEALKEENDRKIKAQTDLILYWHDLTVRKEVTTEIKELVELEYGNN